MADKATNPRPRLAKPAIANVRHLACSAVNQLVTQREVRADVSAAEIEALTDAFLSDSADARHALLSSLRNDGVRTSKIIDEVIPSVARTLGQRWGDDTISFADVTIGSARLQETVRALIAREMSPTVGGLNSTYQRLKSANAPYVMILVPRAEQHTLGAFIAADQFRRLGFEVDVLVDLHPRQVAFALRKRRYAMIGITVSGRRTLASARELVDIIRTTVRRATPIVVGGSLIGTDQDLKTATGADHVATDVRQAIELSGLSIVELDPPQQPVDSLTK